MHDGACLQGVVVMPNPLVTASVCSFCKGGCGSKPEPEPVDIPLGVTKIVLKAAPSGSPTPKQGDKVRPTLQHPKCQTVLA